MIQLSNLWAFVTGAIATQTPLVITKWLAYATAVMFAAVPVLWTFERWFNYWFPV